MTNTTTNSISYMLTTNALTISKDGKTHIVRRDDPLFDRCKAELQRQNLLEAFALLDRPAAIHNATSGRMQVVNGTCMLDGKPVRGELGSRIISFLAENLPVGGLLAFAEKLRKNPSSRAVEDLFSFLEANNHPITEDGDFIAYKRVMGEDAQGRYLDIYSKTMDNRPGAELRMERNEVDDNPDRTCSHGLHVANWHYAAGRYGNGQGVMMEVSVSPADVVAIPTDYNQSKMRVCGYKVRGVVQNPNANKLLVRDFSTGEEELSETEEEDSEDCSDEDSSSLCEECGWREATEGECLCEECSIEEEVGSGGGEEEEEEDNSSL